MSLINVKILRQDGPKTSPYRQTFEVQSVSGANVVSLLMEIQKHPVTIEGVKVSPIQWDCSCLEEVCGACSMIINGSVRQACSALLKDLGREIVLEPLSKFPIIRDLIVDRTRMFDDLKKVSAWVPKSGKFSTCTKPICSR